MDDENEIEKPKKTYGQRRVYQRLPQLTHLLPQFKRFYFVEKRKDINANHSELVDAFNLTIEPQEFYPNPNQYAKWRRIWDEAVVAELALEGRAVILPKSMSRDLVAVDPEGNNLIPRAEDLEGGAQTLAGKLLNDANEMLMEDRGAEEFYTSEELVKRRTYILNVMNHVSRMIQGNKMIAIKANAEKRETVNFMMDLMKRATAGKIDVKGIGELKKNYEPKPVIEVQPNG